MDTIHNDLKNLLNELDKMKHSMYNRNSLTSRAASRAGSRAGSRIGQYRERVTSRAASRQGTLRNNRARSPQSNTSTQPNQRKVYGSDGNTRSDDELEKALSILPKKSKLQGVRNTQQILRSSTPNALLKNRKPQIQPQTQPKTRPQSRIQVEKTQFREVAEKIRKPTKINSADQILEKFLPNRNSNIQKSEVPVHIRKL